MWVFKNTSWFVRPKDCFGVRDAWKEPYLIKTDSGLIENTKCVLTREQFDQLCESYKVNNPLL